MNWLVNDVPQGKYACCAKFRYRQKDHPVFIEVLEDGNINCTYPQGIPAVTPGQQAVFYQGDVCLGGGVIEVIYRDGVDIATKIQEALYGE